MSLTVTRTYASNEILTKAQLDAAFDSVEAKFNATFIDGTEIQDGAIEADHIASNAVTLAKVVDGAFTADASGRAKFADSFVNAAKLATDAVETAKIKDAAVTQAKRAALGQQVSSSSGNFTTTSSSYVDITNLTATITTTGRPVWVGLITDGSDAATFSQVGASGTTNAGSIYKALRDSTTIGEYRAYISGPSVGAIEGKIPASSLYWIDVPSAGTYTYKVQVKIGVSGSTSVCTYSKLLVYEL